MSQHDNI
jgi:hypothetical protein